MDASSSNTVAQMKPAPERAWATYTPQLYVVQGQQLRAAADHSPPRTPQAKPSVAPNGTSCSEAGQTKPGSSQLGGMIGQKQTEHICFGCGKVGHIQINCPYKKAKSHAAAAAVHIQKEVDMGMTGDVTPTDDAQEGETPPEDEDTE